MLVNNVTDSTKGIPSKKAKRKEKQRKLAYRRGGLWCRFLFCAKPLLFFNHSIFLLTKYHLDKPPATHRCDGECLPWALLPQILPICQSLACSKRRDQERTWGTVPRARAAVYKSHIKRKERESANTRMHTNESPHKIIISLTDGD